MHVVVVGETIETLVAVDFLARAGVQVTLIETGLQPPTAHLPLLVGPRLQQWLHTHCPDIGRAVLSGALPFSVNSGRDIWWYAEGRWQPHFRSMLNLCVVEAATCLAPLADCVSHHPSVRRLTATTVRLWHDYDGTTLKGVHYWNDDDIGAQRVAADAVWDGGHITHDPVATEGWWHHQAFYLPGNARLPWQVLMSFPEPAHPYGVVILPASDRRHVIIVGREETPPPNDASEVAQLVTARYGGQDVLGERVPLGEARTVPIGAMSRATDRYFIEKGDLCGALMGQPLSTIPPRLARLYKTLSLPALFAQAPAALTPSISAWFTATPPTIPPDSKSVEHYYQQLFDPALY